MCSPRRLLAEKQHIATPHPHRRRTRRPEMEKANRTPYDPMVPRSEILPPMLRRLKISAGVIMDEPTIRSVRSFINSLKARKKETLKFR